MVLAGQEVRIRITGQEDVHILLTRPGGDGACLTVCGLMLDSKESDSTLDETTCQNCRSIRNLQDARSRIKERRAREW